MASSSPNNDPPSTISPSANPTSQPPSPKYGGFTRFEVELEFVQSLANPSYLLHLATSTTLAPSRSQGTPSNSLHHYQQQPQSQSQTQPQPPVPLLTYPPFIAYLDYLQYWTRPPYSKYLNYPGPTLKHLQLLQSERFREDILRPEIVEQLTEEDLKGTEVLFTSR